MIRYSANLGFLWKHLPLPVAIEHAADAGFDAVECHEPYAFDPASVKAALDRTGLSMVSLNTFTGDQPGEMGFAALPDRRAEAQAAIEQAVAYADAIDCAAVSVVAGHSGHAPDSEATYRENLAYAADLAGKSGRRVVIEPLNSVALPEYHLVSVDAGLATVRAVGAPNLGLMIDTFHVATMESEPLIDVIGRATGHIGHVQFSGFPDRAEPSEGDVDIETLLPEIAALGYDGAFGAEYNPKETEAAGLSWLEQWRSRASARPAQSNEEHS